MSEQGPQLLPDTLDDLIAFIFHQGGGSLPSVGYRDAATAKVFTLLVRDSLAPSLRGLSEELAHTRAELRRAADSTTQASNRLFWVTFVYAVATIVYTGATVWQIVSRH